MNGHYLSKRLINNRVENFRQKIEAEIVTLKKQ